MAGYGRVYGLTASDRDQLHGPKALVTDKDFLPLRLHAVNEDV